MHYLHRYLYALKYGEIQNDLVVRHSCDNPSCVNLGHLSLGTTRDNVLDKMARGRQALGEQNGNAKLTNTDVLKIIEDERDALVVANEFGITRTHVYYLRGKKSWKHILEDK